MATKIAAICVSIASQDVKIDLISAKTGNMQWISSTYYMYNSYRNTTGLLL